MKKILLICLSLIICSITYAQSIDGFVLGEEKALALCHLPRGSQYVSGGLNTSNQVCYKYEQGKKTTHYTFYFKDGIVYKLKISVRLYDPNGLSMNDGHSAKCVSLFEEKIMDLSYDFGEPVVLENKYKQEGAYYWRTPNMKLVYDCRWGYYGPRSDGMYDHLEYLTTLTWELTGENVSSPKQRVKTDNNSYTASGSGFILSSTGIIATNYHVIEDATGVDVFVNSDNGGKKYRAKVLISDKTNDLSLLQIEDSSFSQLPALPYAVNTSVQDVGTSVFALGYPMSNILGEEIKVTDGIISSKTGYQGDIVTYQISVPIQPGNSGGPLFDKQGNLVGITNAGVPDAQNVGYAIKTSYLKNLIDVAPTTISLPANNSISELSFTEKIKRLTPYIVLIKTY